MRGHFSIGPRELLSAARVGDHLGPLKKVNQDIQADEKPVHIRRTVSRQVVFDGKHERLCRLENLVIEKLSNWVNLKTETRKYHSPNLKLPNYTINQLLIFFQSSE